MPIRESWYEKGRAAHPVGTEIDPACWLEAMDSAIAAAGGLGDVAAVSVGAQQHGMVCMDSGGEVVRPALLWNDTRSAKAATDLVEELGGPKAWADAVGVVPGRRGHGKQASMAGRSRTRQRRSHCRGVSSA